MRLKSERTRRGASLLIGVLSAVATTPPPMSAQLEPEYPDNGFLSSLDVRASEVGSDCLTELRPMEAVEVTSASCRVASIDTLHSEPAGVVLSVRYVRWISTPYVSWSDSLQVDEIVLFETERGSARARAIWHRVGANNFLNGAEAAPHAEGLLVQVFNCVRGTGGCVEDILLRRGADRWGTVSLTFLEELSPHIPDGYHLHKGRRIDLETLTFEQPVATRGDANCCPSGLLRGSLELDGWMLRLVSAEVVGRRPLTGR